MARESLPGPWRHSDTTDTEGRADGRDFRHVDVSVQPVHDIEARLAFWSRNYRLCAFFCDLERPSWSLGWSAQLDDDPRKQLHAVNGLSRRIFHRFDRGHGLWSIVTGPGNSSAMVRAGPFRLIHRGAWSVCRDPNEATDDQPGTTEVSERHGGGRNAPQPLFKRQRGPAESVRVVGRANCRNRNRSAANLRHTG